MGTSLTSALIEGLAEIQVMASHRGMTDVGRCAVTQGRPLSRLAYETFGACCRIEAIGDSILGGLLHVLDD